ncbi:MAG: hypothetical protein IKO87_04485 [Kiritimatiellae bacterium]|nr:hypothetical protein [Kiritimatiellia bacterium]
MAKLIPIIATRNTDEIQQAIATGRPLLGSSPIDPTVYENETPTAAKAKYLLAIKSKARSPSTKSPPRRQPSRP